MDLAKQAKTRKSYSRKKIVQADLKDSWLI